MKRIIGEFIVLSRGNNSLYNRADRLRLGNPFRSLSGRVSMTFDQIHLHKKP